MAATRFRLFESKQLAEAYEYCLQAEESLTELELPEKLEDIAIEVPLDLLVQVMACYKYSYEKLVEHELTIYGTEKLFNLKHSH